MRNAARQTIQRATRLASTSTRQEDVGQAKVLLSSLIRPTLAESVIRADHRNPKKTDSNQSHSASNGSWNIHSSALSDTANNGRQFNMSSTADHRIYPAGLWERSLNRCTGANQLRFAVLRMFAQPAAPSSQDIIAALAVCSRIAIFTRKLAVSSNTHPSNITDKSSQSSSHHHLTNILFKTSSLVDKELVNLKEIFEVAQLIMKTMVTKGDIPGVNIYTAYVRVCVHCDQIDAAFQVVKDMKRNGVMPTMDIYKNLVLASAQQGDLDRALDTVHNTVTTASSLTKHATWLRFALQLAIGVEAGKWAGFVFGLLTGVNEMATTIIGVCFGAVMSIRIGVVMFLPQLRGQKFSWSSFTGAVDQVNHSTHSMNRSTSTLQIDQATNEEYSFQSLNVKEVNQYMHAFLVNVLQSIGYIDAALQVLHKMEKKSIPATLSTYHFLIEHLISNNKPTDALELVIKIPIDVRPTAQTFRPIMQWYYDHRHYSQCIDIWRNHITSKFIAPDSELYTLLISSLGKCQHVEEADQLFKCFLRDGFTPNSFVLNTLISIYGKNGRYSDAEHVMTTLMPQFNVQPTVRSFCKLINTARYIQLESYTPLSISSQDQLTIPSIPLPLNHTSQSQHRNTIAAERAWYWYHKLKNSKLMLYNLIPLNSLMNVLNTIEHFTASIAIYRDQLCIISDMVNKNISISPVQPLTSSLSSIFSSPSQQQPSTTLEKCMTTNTGSGSLDLLPISMNYLSPDVPLPLPNTQSYIFFIQACSKTPGYSLQHLIELLYEMRQRKLLRHHLPNGYASKLAISRQRAYNDTTYVNEMRNMSWYYHIIATNRALNAILEKCMRADTLPRQRLGQFVLVTLQPTVPTLSNSASTSQPTPSLHNRLRRKVIDVEKVKTQLIALEFVLAACKVCLDSLYYRNHQRGKLNDKDRVAAVNTLLADSNSFEKEPTGFLDRLSGNSSSPYIRSSRQPQPLRSKKAVVSMIDHSEDDEDDMLCMFTTTEFSKTKNHPSTSMVSLDSVTTQTTSNISDDSQTQTTSTQTKSENAQASKSHHHNVTSETSKPNLNLSNQEQYLMLQKEIFPNLLKLEQSVLRLKRTIYLNT